MASSILSALAGALVFGAAGVCGSLLATALVPHLKRFDDGPPSFDVHPMALIAGAAVLGAVVGFRQTPLDAFALAALATVVLAGIWYCDSKTGIIPDWFTLLPLGLMLVYGLIRHDWMAPISALALFAPFGFVALVSKGIGMGWGDAKLAALGGALVGVEMAAISFTLATLVAIIVTKIRYRGQSVPIALGPYLVCAIAVSIAAQPR